MAVSPELMDFFNQIKQELQKKYKRAQAYARMESMPETARGNSFIVDALKPVIEVISKLDLNGKDSIEGLKEFSKRWQDATKEFPDIYHHLKRFDGAYDDIWGNMSKVDKRISDFLENFDLKETLDIEKETKANEDKPKNVEKQEKNILLQSGIEEKSEEISKPVKNAENILIQGDKKEATSKVVTEEKSEQILQPVKNAENVLKPEQQQTNQVSKAKVIQELEHVAKMFNRSESEISFQSMKTALTDLAEKGFISKDKFDAYKYLFDETKKHGNTERGIFDLSTEIYNQIDEIKHPYQEEKSEHSKAASFKAGIEKTNKLLQKNLITKYTQTQKVDGSEF